MDIGAVLNLAVMTLSQFRSKLYALSKLLGDIQAAVHPKPAKAIPKRIGRRIAGKITGRIMGSIFPPTR